MRRDMDEWKSIRQDVLVNGLSKRAACEKYKLGWHTLNKILLHSEPPGYAKPLEKWNLPECWALLRRRLEAHDPKHGTRSYIQVLRLLEKYSLAQLTAAVEYGLDIDVIDAASIRTIAEHRADEPVKLFPLDGRPQLAHVHVETTDLSSYQVLLTDLSSPTEVTS